MTHLSHDEWNAKTTADGSHQNKKKFNGQRTKDDPVATCHNVTASTSPRHVTSSATVWATASRRRTMRWWLFFADRSRKTTTMPKVPASRILRIPIPRGQRIRVRQSPVASAAMANPTFPCRREAPDRRWTSDRYTARRWVRRLTARPMEEWPTSHSRYTVGSDRQRRRTLVRWRRCIRTSCPHTGSCRSHWGRKLGTG